MSTAEQFLNEKILRLLPTRLEEVAAFADFLRGRENNRALVRAVSQASVARFATIWDNNADAAYDTL